MKKWALWSRLHSLHLTRGKRHISRHTGAACTLVWTDTLSSSSSYPPSLFLLLSSSSSLLPPLLLLLFSSSSFPSFFFSLVDLLKFGHVIRREFRHHIGYFSLPLLTHTHTHTLGFLYTGTFFDPRIVSRTQTIAPLLADFDPSLNLSARVLIRNTCKCILRIVHCLVRDVQ